MKRFSAHPGQVAIYLLMVLVAICLLALLNVDTFVSVRGKNRVQNAGDAAALAAARVQGRLLNRIGQLNFEHVLAAAAGDTNRCAEIVLEQRRLALLGPVDGVKESSKAARKNGMANSEDFVSILKAHAETVRIIYAGGHGGGDPYPEPWPDAWTEYAMAIENAISEGVAAGADNIEFYDAFGGHLLLNREFYQAIAGREWCWFYFNAMSTLESYDSYHDWGPLPSRRSNTVGNSEIYSLHVIARKGPITDTFSIDELCELATHYGFKLTPESFTEDSTISDPDDTWFFFEPGVWRRWSEISPWGVDGYEGFPVVGEVKPEFDTRGCAAICRCLTGVTTVANDSTAIYNWSGAAKPFGSVEVDGTPSPVTANNYFVVPAFTDVRLVPLDSVGGANLATADAGWVTHVREHLGPYFDRGPRTNGGCFFCAQLATWEQRAFRKAGLAWLKIHSHTCTRPRGGGGGHGGTAHGH